VTISGSDGSRRAYLDSSALLKLVHPERESGVLEPVVAALSARVSSDLARVEVLRRARVHGSIAEAQAQRLLEGMRLRPIDADVIAAAITVDPAGLRSLDAIHLATALSVEGLDLFISYDSRLNEAAVAAGLNVESPA
jgi:predicted nucleic acid-binding protein